MSDLIDREQAIEKMKEAADDWLVGHRTDPYWKGFSMGTHIAIQTIYHDVPSVEVVRCRECVMWDDSFVLNGKKRCLNMSFCTDGDFYCGWGSKE